MNYSEMLFALHMHEHVMRQLQADLHKGRTHLANQQFIDDNYESYLLEALKKVKRTAYLIKDADPTE